MGTVPFDTAELAPHVRYWPTADPRYWTSVQLDFATMQSIILMESPAARELQNYVGR
jgi:hypothetical protein